MRFSVFWSETAPLGSTGRELDFDEKIEIFEKKIFFRIYMVCSHNRTKYEGRWASRTVPPAGESKKTHNLLIHCAMFKQSPSIYLSIQDAKFEVSLSETQPSGWGSFL